MSGQRRRHMRNTWQAPAFPRSALLSSPYPYAGDDPTNNNDPSRRGPGADSGAFVGTVAAGFAIGATCAFLGGLGFAAAGLVYGIGLSTAGGLIGAGFANETYNWADAELNVAIGVFDLATTGLQALLETTET